VTVTVLKNFVPADTEISNTGTALRHRTSHRLDALFIPSWRSENILNKAGYPAVILPFGEVPNTLDPPLPKGFDAEPMPFGVTFIGTACSEPRLIELAYAFEQASRKRRPPVQFP